MHATCLVFAPLEADIEEILAPFDENAESEVANYPRYHCPDVDAISDDVESLEELKKLYKEETGKELTPDDYECWNGGGYWDWYQIGGRWAGMYKAKRLSEYTSLGELSWGSQRERDKTEISVGRVSDIDWYGMIKERKEQLRTAVNFLCNAIEDLPLVEPLTRDMTRDEYLLQPRIKALSELAQEEELIRPLSSIEPVDLNLSEEMLLDTLSLECIATYSAIIDKEWIRKDEMESEEDSSGSFILKHIQQIYSEGSEDQTMVYLVDYHS